MIINILHSNVVFVFQNFLVATATVASEVSTQNFFSPVFKVKLQIWQAFVCFQYLEKFIDNHHDEAIKYTFLYNHKVY